jgi:hypothetical protein
MLEYIHTILTLDNDRNIFVFNLKGFLFIPKDKHCTFIWMICYFPMCRFVEVVSIFVMMSVKSS